MPSPCTRPDPGNCRRQGSSCPKAEGAWFPSPTKPTPLPAASTFARSAGFSHCADRLQSRVRRRQFRGQRGNPSIRRRDLFRISVAGVWIVKGAGSRTVRYESTTARPIVSACNSCETGARRPSPRPGSATARYPAPRRRKPKALPTRSRPRAASPARSLPPPEPIRASARCRREARWFASRRTTPRRSRPGAAAARRVKSGRKSPKRRPASARSSAGTSAPARRRTRGRGRRRGTRPPPARHDAGVRIGRAVVRVDRFALGIEELKQWDHRRAEPRRQHFEAHRLLVREPESV